MILSVFFCFLPFPYCKLFRSSAGCVSLPSCIFFKLQFFSQGESPSNKNGSGSMQFLIRSQ
ncbi:hypothetical protein BOX30_10155 [Leptospirillum ferriphilum]|uniref:Uncharacterized protein n=1 Tax=Leptospirillum ferriphilum TaxID=178606 RepID=A0A1V3SYA0_9BACT|nr:hypothetical protein ABH19_11415 [Leptospirillum sp. Group II 'CF-1']OOH73916.1 hypothetical protein BOX24_02665 [Leptospirillum ferriphilum]OOH77259.1 hypothetical protein BOX30_10155 [Leptospirillum ferriphilum]